MANELADCWLINGRPVEDVAPMVSDLRARSRPGKPLNFGITGFALVRETDEEAERDLAALLEVQRSSYPTRRTEMQKHIDPQAGTLRYAEKYKGKAMIGANGGTLPGLVGSYDRVAHQLARFREAEIGRAHV